MNERLRCPECYTGKVSFQLAKMKSGKYVLVWAKCSTAGCMDRYPQDRIKANANAHPDVDYYLKVNQE